MTGVDTPWGACTHPMLKACYIKRHNEMVAAISRAIAQGDRGRWLLVADLRADHLGELSELQKKEVVSRVPRFMLPKVTEQDRLRMRPDILFVDGMDEGWQDDEVDEGLLASMKQRCVVYLLEVGYCRDGAPEAV